jgi:hypothetical protein
VINLDEQMEKAWEEYQKSLFHRKKQTDKEWLEEQLKHPDDSGVTIKMIPDRETREVKKFHPPCPKCEYYLQQKKQRKKARKNLL